jgi:hypothetical protein
MEEKTEVKGFMLISYKCDKCILGSMRYMGINSTINFIHKCDKCEYVCIFDKIYPEIDYY